MIRTIECVQGQHARCAHNWQGRHVCLCPCHEPEVLEVEADRRVYLYACACRTTLCLRPGEVLECCM